MITRIIIDIETTFKPLHDKVFPEEDITIEAEKSFHEAIDEEIRLFIEDEELLKTNVLDIDFYGSVEDYKTFSDYGKVKITIQTTEVKVLVDTEGKK